MRKIALAIACALALVAGYAVGQVSPTFPAPTFSAISLYNLWVSGTAPSISSGFGTGATIPTSNGAASFLVNVGTGGAASSGVIGLPAAVNGWNCYATDITTKSASVFLTKQTAFTANSATLTNYNTSAAATAWGASDILHVVCFAY